VAEGLVLAPMVWLGVRGRYRRVEVRFGFARLCVEGRELALVAPDQPAHGRGP